MPKRFDLVVFDWDGTLIDSAGAIAACIQAACRDLGLPVPDEARARHVIGLGLADSLAHAVPGLPPSEYPRVAERYRHHFLARDASLPLFPGTREMLEGLRVNGHRLAIATGKSHAGLVRALAHAGLADFFDATRCADQSASKPAPDMLLDLMAHRSCEIDVINGAVPPAARAVGLEAPVNETVTALVKAKEARIVGSAGQA